MREDGMGTLELELGGKVDGQGRGDGTGRTFPGVIISATNASRTRHTPWPL